MVGVGHAVLLTLVDLPNQRIRCRLAGNRVHCASTELVVRDAFVSLGLDHVAQRGGCSGMVGATCLSSGSTQAGSAWAGWWSETQCLRSKTETLVPTPQNP